MKRAAKRWRDRSPIVRDTSSAKPAALLPESRELPGEDVLRYGRAPQSVRDGDGVFRATRSARVFRAGREDRACKGHHPESFSAAGFCVGCGRTRNEIELESPGSLPDEDEDEESEGDHG